MCYFSPNNKVRLDLNRVLPINQHLMTTKAETDYSRGMTWMDIMCHLCVGNKQITPPHIRAKIACEFHLPSTDWDQSIHFLLGSLCQLDRLDFCSKAKALNVTSF